MINYKSAKLGLGIALSLSLSACSMLDFQNNDPIDTRYDRAYHTHSNVQERARTHSAHTNQRVQHDNARKAGSVEPKRVQKSYVSKDVEQKSAPGPVRKVAPQLPVIQ